MTIRMRVVCVGIALCTVSGARASQAATCDGHDTTVLSKNTMLVKGQTVLEGGDARNPPVVLFHEMPGLTHHDLVLGARLVCEGFHVYMPLMFGDIDQDRMSLGHHQACDAAPGARPLFWCSKVAGEHPILATWIRDAVKTIGADGRPIAIIGMCLTGTFALSLAEAANVTVAVLAQPTAPFGLRKAATLDVPDETLQFAVRALAGRHAGVFLVRARFDLYSRSRKIDRLRVALRGAPDDGLTDIYIRQLFGVRHSVLTRAAPHPDNQVMRDLLAMLRRHL